MREEGCGGEDVVRRGEGSGVRNGVELETRTQ